MKYSPSDSEGGGCLLQFTQKPEASAGWCTKGGARGERFRAALSFCILIYDHIYNRFTVSVYISYISNLIHLPLGKKTNELAQETTDSSISAAGTRELLAAGSPSLVSEHSAITPASTQPGNPACKGLADI